MRWRFLLLVFGLSLILFGGIQEIVLWCVAGRKPQELTCEQLGGSGPGGNAHIVLRDYYLCTSAFVYEERGGRWTVAWIPAVPSGRLAAGDDDPLADIRVLVKLPHARSMADVVHAAHQRGLQGMVTNAIEDLGTDERLRLQSQYPGVDFDHCQIFEVGRKPAGVLPVTGSLVGGTFLILYVLWSILGGGRVVHGPLPEGAERTPLVPGR